MATCSSLRERARELGEQYSAHSAQVTRTQRAFISGSQSQPEDGTGAGTREPAAWALHHDTASIFRFLRRAKFAEQHALRNLLASASWRLERAHSLPPPPPRAASPAATSAPTSADDSGAAAAAGGGEQDEDEPLVRFDERLRDKLGRPAGILRLARVRRSPSDDGSLESLKARATHAYELARRWLCDLHDHQHHHHHREDGDGERVLQIVLLVDVQGAGISNLELELLPFLLQLARAHYPGLVGAVFVLNYGWLHSGMWQLARSILPTSALERIAFPSAADLLNFFDRDKLPTTCGGELELEPEGHTTLWRKYADDANDDDGRYSAEPSDDDAAAAHKTVSRVASTDSLADGYHTPMANPGHSRQSSTSVRFGMTALPQHDDDDGDDDNQPPPPRSRSRQGSQQHSRRSSAADLVSLARVPSLAELHNRLDQTRRAIDLDSSSSSSSTFDEPLSPSRDDDDLTLTLSPRVESDGTEDEAKERAARAYALEMSETAYRRQVRTAREAQGRAPSTATSAEPSRAPSRFASPSREPASLPPPPQPSRKGVRFSTEPITPSYYPAAHRHEHHRNSKARQRQRRRDFVRTLTYLAALRLLALHRALERLLSRIIGASTALLRVDRLASNALLALAGRTNRRGSLTGTKGEQETRGASREREDDAQARGAGEGQPDVRWLHALLMLALLRAHATRRIAALTFVDTPRYATRTFWHVVRLAISRALK